MYDTLKSKLYLSNIVNAVRTYERTAFVISRDYHCCGFVRSALHSFLVNMSAAADIQSSFMNAIALLNLSVRAFKAFSKLNIFSFSFKTSFSCFSVRMDHSQ